MRHEQVEPAVAVVIEPGRARREPVVADAGGVGHVREAKPAKVVEQAVAAERGDVEVCSAVVVVAGGHAHAVGLHAETGGRGHVGKRAVAIVFIEGEQRFLRHAPARTWS